MINPGGVDINIDTTINRNDKPRRG